jgi:SAM-dependent methyltransferase
MPRQTKAKDRKTDYRVGWLDPGAASAYEDDLRREGSYESWLAERERGLLLGSIDTWLSGKEIHYLDFACGTGRILVLLEPRVQSATGIDNSPSMLALAAERAPRATLIHGDVSVDPRCLSGTYNLVTAFRFFLNAGEDLRSAVLRVLHGALTDDGILIFNVHANAWSLHALSVLFRRHVLRQRWWNQRSYRQVRTELRAHGFEIVELHGYNFLTRKGYRLLPQAVAARLDQALGRMRPFAYLASELMFICRRAGDGSQPRGTPPHASTTGVDSVPETSESWTTGRTTTD